jgi:hypothetical protein
MSLSKVHKLLALAAQENEEGRTAAWMAAKFIRENGYRVTDGPSRVSPFEDVHEERRWSSGPPAPSAPRGHETRATEAGHCWSCRRPYVIGEPIYKPERREAVCLECAESL